MPNRKHIIILDDNPDIAASLKSMLLASGKVEVVDYYRSIAKFFEYLPDDDTPNFEPIIILDIELGPVNGLDHVKKIKLLVPGCSIIVYSGHLVEEYLLNGIKKGIQGYVVKGGDPQVIFNAIDAVSNGQYFLDPKTNPIVVKIIQQKTQIFDAPKGIEGLGSDLTFREINIAKCLISGMTYQEAADSQNLSINTIRHYVQSLYRKLDVHNKMELINKLKGRL